MKGLKETEEKQWKKLLQNHLILLGIMAPNFFFFFLFRAAPVAYEGSQARGRIRATAAILHYSYSNMRSEPCLQRTPQLTAMLDPQPTEQGQELNLCPLGC